MLPDLPGELQLQIYTLPPLLGFAVFLGIALMAAFRTKRSPTTRLFAVICFLASLISIDVALVSLINDEQIALQLDRFIYLFFIFSLPVYIQFVHSFLNIRNRKGLEYIAYACCTALLFFTQSDLFITGFNKYFFGKIAKAGPVFHLFSLAGGLTVVYCSYTLFIYLKKARDGYEKNRIKYILGGIGVSTVLVLLNTLPISGLSIYPMGNFVFLPAIFLAFGVLKYDLLDIDTVLRRCVLYFLLTGILSLFYFFLIYVLNLCLMHSGWYHPYGFPFVLSLFMVLLFNPLKDKVQNIVDQRLFRGKYDYHKTLREISERMASLRNTGEIVRLLSSRIGDALQTTHISVVLSGDGEKGSTIYFGGENTEDAFVAGLLTPSHSFIRILEKIKKPLSRETIEGLPISDDEEESIHKIFQVFGASMAVPMISRDHLTGILITSEKKSGEVFTVEDIELLRTLAHQGAIAIENARSYEELQNLNQVLEEKVKQRTAELTRALEEKERTQKQLIRSESLAAIGQLVAGIAHELNNPLSGASSMIQSDIEILKEDSDQSAQKSEVLEDLVFSLKELTKAKDIVKSLLDLSRQTEAYVEKVNIRDVLEDSLCVFHNQFIAMDVRIEKIYQSNIPEIDGNFSGLGQVFMNLIKNALQALPEGKGVLKLKTRYDKDNNRVVVECHDTGNGIPQDIVKDIFKPFFTTKEVGTGTGLGLYIVHEIIKKHGGRIDVSTSIGKGTTFVVELPLTRSES